jgi:hypothetical protein
MTGKTRSVFLVFGGVVGDQTIEPVALDAR